MGNDVYLDSKKYFNLWRKESSKDMSLVSMNKDNLVDHDIYSCLSNGLIPRKIFKGHVLFFKGFLWADFAWFSIRCAFLWFYSSYWNTKMIISLLTATPTRPTKYKVLSKFYVIKHTSSIKHFTESPTLMLPSRLPTWSTYPPWTWTSTTENSTSCQKTLRWHYN